MPGPLICLAFGSARARHHEGFVTRQPLTPGTAVRLTVALNAKAVALPPGSRIAQLLASSDFPRLQPCPHTKAPPWGEQVPWVACSEIALGISRLVQPVAPDGP